MQCSVEHGNTKGELYQLLSSNSSSPFVQHALLQQCLTPVTKTGPLKHAARANNWLHALAAEFFAKGTMHYISPQVKASTQAVNAHLCTC
jgi:hypothetical protein